MLPIYFGDSARALFGLYHPAQKARAKPVSVVLCHPFGNEYFGAYRTMRVLADQLANAGVSVLRFDYYGTGDSAGFGLDASIEQWLADIDCAIEEIKGTVAAETTSLIGVRLGATLAAHSAKVRTDIDRLVLWEPILHGREHVDQHMARHQEWLGLGRCRTQDSTANEALGFPLSDQLIEEMTKLELTDPGQSSLNRALLLFHNRGGQEQSKALTEFGNQVERQCISSPDFWLGRTAFDQPLVSKSNIESIVTWFIGDAT
jgi:pimeloyl-ACP methyl ester carboxylesterase